MDNAGHCGHLRLRQRQEDRKCKTIPSVYFVLLCVLQYTNPVIPPFTTVTPLSASTPGHRHTRVRPTCPLQRLFLCTLTYGDRRSLYRTTHSSTVRLTHCSCLTPPVRPSGRSPTVPVGPFSTVPESGPVVDTSILLRTLRPKCLMKDSLSFLPQRSMTLPLSTPFSFTKPRPLHYKPKPV